MHRKVTLNNQNNFFRPYIEQYQQTQQYWDGNQYEQESSKSRYWKNRSPRKYNGYEYDYFMYTGLPEHQYKYSQSPPKQPSYYHHQHHHQHHHQEKIQTKSKELLRDRNMHQPVWQQLYSYGLQAKKQLLQLHQAKKQAIDMQCTFEPMVRKTSKYALHGNSNFLQRNRIWHEGRIEKIVKQKQEQVTKDLQNCTFKPKLNKYKMKEHRGQKSAKNYENKKRLQLSRSMTKITKNNNNHNRSVGIQENDSNKKKSAFNEEEVGKIKHLIRKELKRIQL